ncbi:MAG: roadblock/LC7 domain-containing protein [Candidatus Helarchaeota archaeon]
MEDIMNQIKYHLRQIKSITGVENVVLTQRDGQPIESAGVWLSKNEIFGVCSIVSAIFNVAEQLHIDTLNYLLIDGERAKILVAPIHTHMEQFNANTKAEYFLTVTAKLKVNLGAIMLSMRDTLSGISRTIEASGNDFKPPLRSYDKNALKQILDSFNVKEDGSFQESYSTININLSEEISNKIRDCIFDFSRTVPGVKMASISLNGGYNLLNVNLDSNVTQSEGALSYTLFDTSKKVISTLKQTPINNVLIDCDGYTHFIYGCEMGIFSTYISRGQKRLGLLRLLIPQYVKIISDLLLQSQKLEAPILNLNNIFDGLKIGDS